MQVLVIAYTILNGSKNPNSPGGNHIIVMINSQEKYMHLSKAVKDIANKIKLIKSITINGHNFNIEFFLGADMKFLAICLWLEAANATYSCIWCKYPAEERHDTSQVTVYNDGRWCQDN